LQIIRHLDAFFKTFASVRIFMTYCLQVMRLCGERHVRRRKLPVKNIKEYPESEGIWGTTTSFIVMLWEIPS
jgi:hypothetical protein